jgi:hypothetical protein
VQQRAAAQPPAARVGEPSRRAIASTMSATRALWPLVNGLLLSTIWPNGGAMSSR